MAIWVLPGGPCGQTTSPCGGLALSRGLAEMHTEDPSAKHWRGRPFPVEHWFLPKRTIGGNVLCSPKQTGPPVPLRTGPRSALPPEGATSTPQGAGSCVRGNPPLNWICLEHDLPSGTQVENGPTSTASGPLSETPETWFPPDDSHETQLKYCLFGQAHACP